MTIVKIGDCFVAALLATTGLDSYVVLRYLGEDSSEWVRSDSGFRDCHV